MSAASPILVIKLGALGDFVQALGPFAAIRHHHQGQKLVLLTTAPFADLADASGCFDEIFKDGRPAWWQVGGLIRLRRWLRDLSPARVYDLQTSGRSSAYLKLFGRTKPEWSGIAVGCSHPHANPQRDFMHTLERQTEQLAMAGITATPPVDETWLDADTTGFDLPERYVLLAPGGAVHRPDKRWSGYGELAQRLLKRGLTPVLLGTAAEGDVIAEALSHCPQAIDLGGRTNLLEIAGLARRAAGAVGNDTGPMHLIARTGCPSLVLYSAASDPALCAQRGPAVEILRKPDLATLDIEEVEAHLALR